MSQRLKIYQSLGTAERLRGNFSRFGGETMNCLRELGTRYVALNVPEKN
jgi:hypothetical protein